MENVNVLKFGKNGKWKNGKPKKMEFWKTWKIEKWNN